MTAVAFEAERWYADKGRPVAEVEPLDALGGLELVRVEFEDGGAAHYALVPEHPGWSELLAGAGRRFSYDGALPSGLEERLPVDQSHTSWRIGEAYVKCYRRLTAGTNPEVELLRVLTAHGFEHAPAYRGSLAWKSLSGEEFAIALATEFVADGEEGWDWAAELARAGDTSFAVQLGRLTRRLHETLSAALPSRTATTADAEGRHRRGEETLERALALAPELREHERRVRSELAALSQPEETARVARIHGDLHVGQFMRARDRYLIVDFEGEPGLSAGERRALDTQLRDVASLLRSIDHAGRYAVERHGADPAGTETWIIDARAALREGYGVADIALLRALEWERAIYEFTYAATYLPRWMYAPRGGLNALLRETS